YFAHYYMLGIPIVVLCSMLFVGHLRRSGLGRAAVTLYSLLLVYGAVVQVLFAAGNVPLVVKSLAATDTQTVAVREVARSLANGTDGDARLLVYGSDSQLYYYSGLRPSQPVIHLIPVDQIFQARPSAVGDSITGRVERALQLDPPDVIVLSEQAAFPDGATALLQRIRARIRNEYVEMQVAPAPVLERAGIEAVFRRRESPAAPP
ncbi:MAG TPA: hypothetical protein VM534_03410, partial [Thermoanaerobaculia bacterium]|nr:hypothetical protein [Thermoanaerobaculia bacterium]